MLAPFITNFCTKERFFLIIILLTIGWVTNLPQRAYAHDGNPSALLLADPTDAYYPLAQEISRTENIPVLHTLAEVLEIQPTYLLWVISPSNLSDTKVIEMGHALAKQPIAVGIISASSLDKARALWLRARNVRGETLVAANAPNPSAHIQATLKIWQNEQQQTMPLTRENLLHYLHKADYLTFTGHGAARYWKLDEQVRLSRQDIRPLPPVVVQSASCNTFRLWEKDSLALAFVDQGAAAYTGFAYSPNEGYLFGQFDGLPYRYSYPDFPVGVIVQLQNRGALQGFAAFPYFFLLGDPRLFLQREVPYNLKSDTVEGSSRTLVYQNIPAGIIPVRVKGGAEYSFVHAVGITTASDHDLFYNSRLQMLNFGKDKFLLVATQGGELELRFERHSRWYWLATDILSDSLDFALLFLPQSGGDKVSAIFALLPLSWVFWQIRHRRLDRLVIKQAVFVGSLSTLLQAGYAGIRLDSITIISKPVVVSPLALGVNWFLTCSGPWMFLRACLAKQKLAALLVILFPLWFPFLFIGGVVEGFNRLVSMVYLGVGLYHHRSSLQVLIVFIIELGFYLAIFYLCRSAREKKATLPAELL